MRASFDKLRMRFFLGAIKIAPHPELVEGRTLVMQADHSNTKQRADHFQHMHIEIGTRHDPRVATH